MHYPVFVADCAGGKARPLRLVRGSPEEPRGPVHRVRRQAQRFNAGPGGGSAQRAAGEPEEIRRPAARAGRRQLENAAQILNTVRQTMSKAAA